MGPTPFGVRDGHAVNVYHSAPYGSVRSFPARDRSKFSECSGEAVSPVFHAGAPPSDQRAFCRPFGPRPHSSLPPSTTWRARKAGNKPVRKVIISRCSNGLDRPRFHAMLVHVQVGSPQAHLAWHMDCRKITSCRDHAPRAIGPYSVAFQRAAGYRRSDQGIGAEASSKIRNRPQTSGRLQQRQHLGVENTESGSGRRLPRGPSFGMAGSDQPVIDSRSHWLRPAFWQRPRERVGNV